MQLEPALTPGPPARPAQALVPWVLPALALLAAALALRAGLHDRWLDLVWSVRALDAQTWSPLLTRLRYALDAGALVLAALAAALVLRHDAGRARLARALALLTLGAVSSALLDGWLGAARGPLLGAALALLGALALHGARRDAPPARRWGEVALLACALIFAFGALPADLTGRPTALLGSARLGVWWNELGRPAARDLGFVAFLVGAALAWLERRPDALRGGVARAAVAVGLAGFTAAVYVGVVGGVGALLGTQNNVWLGMLAAALIALAFGGVRAALSRGVNRVLYGERDDPFLVTRRLARVLSGAPEPRERLASALDLLVSALRLPGAELRLVSGELLRRGADAAAGETWPLVAGGERVGTLTVARRSAREVWSEADRVLLEAVTGQLADAARAWALSQALTASRERLVRAGEDERRRLRRDLHDGLGPALAGLGLKLEAARLLLARSPERAQAHLAALSDEVRESVGEVRRLVHDLRPPKLDDLGLRAALDDALSGARAADLAARLDAPDALPPLGAAAEVAVYRIAQEALTNVLKHARARRVTLRVCARPDALTLEVEDDGVGLPDVREPGVGSRSMRERAEALSGTLEWIRLEGGGTLVRATLPTGEPLA